MIGMPGKSEAQQQTTNTLDESCAQTNLALDPAARCLSRLLLTIVWIFGIECWHRFGFLLLLPLAAAAAGFVTLGCSHLVFAVRARRGLVVHFQ